MRNYPTFATGTIVNNPTSRRIHTGADGHVYCLLVEVNDKIIDPHAGQFFMIRRKGSKHLLGRPISVYDSHQCVDKTQLWFLVLEKGNGTKELCQIEEGAKVELVGPLGNEFEKPEKGQKVALIGGGIGIAPVVGFSQTLEPKSYDFYACFKVEPYGLGPVNAKNLNVITENALCGRTGMLDAIFGVDEAEKI